ncbi:MAG TPA: hypothetical protein V6C86_14950 [Oculatellaceae cyanobacterium]
MVQKSGQIAIKFTPADQRIGKSMREGDDLRAPATPQMIHGRAIGESGMFQQGDDVGSFSATCRRDSGQDMARQQGHAKNDDKRDD